MPTPPPFAPSPASTASSFQISGAHYPFNASTSTVIVSGTLANGMPHQETLRISYGNSSSFNGILSFGSATYTCTRCSAEVAESEHIEQRYSDGSLAWDGCCYCWDKVLDLMPRQYPALVENARLRTMLAQATTILDELPQARRLMARVRAALSVPVEIPLPRKRRRRT